MSNNQKICILTTFCNKTLKKVRGSLPTKEEVREKILEMIQKRQESGLLSKSYKNAPEEALHNEKELTSTLPWTTDKEIIH